MIWEFRAQFDSREEAIAFMDLVRDIAPQSSLHRYKKDNGHRPNWNTRLGRLLLDSMTNGRTYDTEHFEAICAENEYAQGSWSATMTKLVEGGKVERVCKGLYRKVHESEYCS